MNARATYKRILVPLDGSGFAEVAIPHASEIAKCMGATLVLLRIVPPLTALLPTDSLTLPKLDTLEERVLEEAETYLRARAGALRSEGLTVEAFVMQNSIPALGILDAVTSKKIDLIVMSTHGRSGLGQWVFGSVAAKVIRKSPVPVLLIRSTEASTP